jgi:hypothetical protein
MGEPSLLVLCGVAFVAVLAILGILAGLIEVIVRLFPAPAPTGPPTAPIPPGAQPPGGDAAAFVAAIHAVVGARHPNLVITNLEERQDS